MKSNITMIKNTQYKTSYLWVWFLLLFLNIAVLSGCSEEPSQNSNTSESKKKPPNVYERDGFAHFTLAQTDFKVPKEYFRSASETQFGFLRSAKLWALLPDFEGYDRDKNHYEFVEQPGWGRKLWITLEQRGHKSMVQERVKTEQKTKYSPLYEKKLGNFYEKLYGLEYYKSSNYLDDFYLYRPEGITVVLIHCRSKEAQVELESPSCDLRWDFSKAIAVEQNFSLEFLPQWKNIWEKTQLLLQNNKPHIVKKTALETNNKLLD